MNPSADTLIDLHAYCSTDPLRANKLGLPWSEGSYSYACDGRILLRVPRREDIHERDAAPGIAHLVTTAYGEHRPLPTQPEPACRPCGACAPPADAKPGDGATSDGCAECAGTGTVPMVVPVPFGPQYLSSFYLERLRALPGVQLANHPSDPNGPLHFHFDGGDGVVMPIRKD